MRTRNRNILPILFGALQIRPAELGIERLRQSILTVSATEWPLILRAAEHHRIAPLMYRNLSRYAADETSPQIRQQLRESALAYTQRNLFLLQRLTWLLDLLDRHQIRAIPFKGPTLALGAYGDLSLRPCGDLDLLLAPEDLVRAKDLLVAETFEPLFPTSSRRESAYLASLTGEELLEYLKWQREYHLIRRSDGLNIDLHCGIVPGSFAIGLEHDVFFGDMQTVKLAGREMPQLSPESMLLVLCANGTKDYWSELDRVADVAAVITKNADLNWQSVLDRAEQLSIRRALLLALELSRPLLNEPLPSRVLREIESDRAIPTLTAKIRRRWLNCDGRRASADSLLFHLQIRDRWSDRFRYFSHQFVPTVGDRAAAPLPHALSFLHYVIRPFRLFRKFATHS